MIDSLHSLLGDQLKENESLAKYTAARIGGHADYLYIARSDISETEVKEALQTAWDEKIPVHVLGGGANVLVSDLGIRGLVIVNKMTNMNMLDSGIVQAASGTSLSTLARRCQRQGLSGIEWAISVPGTLGGAVVNNAGAHGGDMHQILLDARVYENGAGTITYSVDDMQYGYRSSKLKRMTNRRFFVLDAKIQLQSANPADIEQTMRELIAYRKNTQPPGASLGSIFKNPPDDYAGRLIEASGLKGYTIANVQVSTVHANFFVNLGAASASDYYLLIRHVQQTVREKSGITLEPEIELVGDWGAYQ